MNPFRSESTLSLLFTLITDRLRLFVNRATISRKEFVKIIKKIVFKSFSMMSVIVMI